MRYEAEQLRNGCILLSLWILPNDTASLTKLWENNEAESQRGGRMETEKAIVENHVEVLKKLVDLAVATTSSMSK